MSGCHTVFIPRFEESRHLLVMRISGSLEHGNANSFLRDARAAIREYSQARLEVVVLDVGGVTYIDSSGIGAFVELYKDLSERSVEMRLENIRPGVKKVMGLLGLEKFLGVE